MGKIIGEGITFDDVLLVPAYSEVTPNMIDLTTYLTKKIKLNIPMTVSYTHLDVYKRQIQSNGCLCLAAASIAAGHAAESDRWHRNMISPKQFILLQQYIS